LVTLLFSHWDRRDDVDNSNTPVATCGTRRSGDHRATVTAPSILLVVAGVMIALTPGLPRVELELVLFGILPPLVYLAGVEMLA
jgi:hypothetical protein